MTITISFPERTEQALRRKAAERGQEVGEFVRELVERQLASTNGVATRAPPTADALKPFWDGFAESGLSDDELTALFEEARNEVWYERQAGTPQ